MDLTTTYLGLKLKNPVVAAASPMSHSLDAMRRLEDAGASAIVMYSLFEEQIVHEQRELLHYLERDAESFAEATSYFPRQESFNLGPEEYLEHLHKARKALGIPVIGSLNGVSAGGWTEYAKKMEESGADAIELNVYYIPTDPAIGSADVEQRYIDVLEAVKGAVHIPVAMKLSPYFSAMANMARRLDEAGANALVLFNRFYQPDIDLEALEITPNLHLSSSIELRLPLRWIAILYGRVKANLAATTGVHTADDVIKLLMAGADATMLASAVLKHGPQRIQEILADMARWFEVHEYESVTQMKGSMSQRSVADPTAFERANYMKVLQAYR